MTRPPDMQQLMKQAQQMQERLLAAQEQLASQQFEGTSGGGVVRAVVNGSHELLEVEISPEVIDPSDVDMLGDLVVAAVNAAMRQAAEAANRQLGDLGGGLGGLLA